MAKQAGPVKLTGTFNDLCFYQMEGQHYVRRRSSLNGKRFQQDAAFAGSRKSASRFATGNRLASKVYQLVQKEKRVYRLFCYLKRRSILLLKEGKHLQEVEALLFDNLIQFGVVQDPPIVIQTQGVIDSSMAKSTYSQESNSQRPYRSLEDSKELCKIAHLPGITSNQAKQSSIKVLPF